MHLIKCNQGSPEASENLARLVGQERKKRKVEEKKPHVNPQMLFQKKEKKVVHHILKDQQEFVVQSILSHKFVDYTLFFEIQWKGYKETSWIPASNLNPGCFKLVTGYYHKIEDEIIDKLTEASSSPMNYD